MAFSILRFWEEKEKFWKKSQILRREEKSEIPYPSFEKRNLQKGSPLSRREREICKKVLLFREEKEKWIFFSQVSRGDSSVPNSSYKLIFVKIRAKDGRFLGKSTGKIQVFAILTSFSVIETGKKSQKLREVRYLFLKNLVFKNLRNWEEKEIFSQNLENREENEICVSESRQSRREREFFL